MMTYRSGLKLWMCALALCAGLLRAADEKPAGWSVTPLLPPDTLAVFTVNDSQKAIAKLQKTGLWNIYNSPDVQRAFRGPLMTAQFTLAMVEAQAQFKISDILSYFSQGEITIAMLGMDKQGPDGKPLPDLLISVQAKDKIGPMMDEINKRLDQLKAAAGGQLVIQQTPVGNSTVNKVTVPGQPIAINFAQVDGNVLVTLGEGRLEKLLALHEKYKAAGVKPADGAQAEVLGQTASFMKVVEKAGPDSDVMLYVNVEALLKNPLVDARPKTEQQKMEWQMAGLDTIRAVAYASGARDKGIRETFYIDVPAAQRKGILTLADGEGLLAETLAAAPKNSLFAAAMRISPEKLLERAVELAAMQDPAARENVNAWLIAAGQQLNIDIKKEALNALTGQGIFSLSMVAKHPKLPISFPQPLLTLGIKDMAALKSLVSAIRTAVKDNFEFTELTSGENEIVTGREKFTQDGREPGQFSYVIDKKEIIISLYPLALREELNRRAAIAKGAPSANAGPLAGSLSDDPDFKAARSALSGQPQAMLYVDTGALAVAAYDTLVPVAQLRARIPQVDVTALPTSDVLMQNLGGTVLSFSTDADGIMAEGYSPSGALSLLSLIPAAIQARQAAGGGPVGFAPFGGGGRAGFQQRNAQVLEQSRTLQKDLTAFAKENNGNYPATLQEMKPKYLAGFSAEDMGNIVYRGKQDGPDKIVAHSTEKQRGPITILTQDGRVAQIGRGELGKVLNEGYKGAATVAPAGGATEAVKPPKPPEF
jgi:hypothetical protein